MAKDGRGDRTAANCQPLRRCLHREEGTKKKAKKRKSQKVAKHVWEEEETERGKLTQQKLNKTKKKDKRRKLEKAAKNIWEEEESESGKLTQQKLKETEKTRVAEGIEATRRRLRESGNSGLKLFNRENGTCFEMVDVLSWGVTIGGYPDFHRHMNITAKLPEWDSPRRCFLEINDSPNPTHCFIAEVDPETANNFCSCCHVDYKVLHPPSGGFRIGWFDYPKGFTGPRLPLTASIMKKFFCSSRPSSCRRLNPR
ncbi:unnamed protein product [Cuscuta epithymum]|uniref:DUF3615 domain-containing protein n=1 Tax=Cuscuta epithymum TaxID=186058 RepID=A0AAV0F3V2_9ASTE|nr:unnamed protein product [Cuscuta epithymum]